jgi:hypothetical protein
MRTRGLRIEATVSPEEIERLAAEHREKALREEVIRGFEARAAEVRRAAEKEALRIAALAISEEAIKEEMDRVRAASVYADSLATQPVIRDTATTPIEATPVSEVTPDRGDDGAASLGAINNILRDPLAYDQAKLGQINAIVKTYFKERPRGRR